MIELGRLSIGEGDLTLGSSYADQQAGEQHKRAKRARAPTDTGGIPLDFEAEWPNEEFIGAKEPFSAWRT